MNVGYLAQLIRDNPLTSCEKLVLDSPGSDLGQSAMELLINSLPALRNRIKKEINIYMIGKMEVDPALNMLAKKSVYVYCIRAISIGRTGEISLSFS